MKILVFGRGVISTQYAWALENSGNEIEFYIRPEHIKKYGNSINLEIWDARINSKGTFINENWSVVFKDEIDIENDYDIIFVSVNSHQIKDVVSFLAPRVGNATVLFFNNFWVDPIEAIAPIPLNQIVWGFPGAGGGFDKDGTLKGGFMKSVFFGTIGTALSDRDIKIRNLFISAGFKVSEQKDFRSWLWNHYALNAAMEAAMIKVGGFKEMFDSPESLANIGVNIREIITLLKARGSKIDISTRIFAHTPLILLGSVLKNIVFKEGSLVNKMMKDNNSKIGYSYRDVFIEAKRLGVSMPNFESNEHLFDKSLFEVVSENRPH